MSTSTLQISPDLCILYSKDATAIVPASTATATCDSDDEDEQQRPDDTGLKVWQCADVLLRLMATGVVNVEGKSVVELGSGTGVVGVGAEKCGAAEVVVSDLEDLVPLMQHAILINDCSRTTAKGYRWGGDCSDVFGGLMEEDTISALAMSVSSLLHRENRSECVCVFKEREPSREQRFLRLCEENGFTVEDRTGAVSDALGVTHEIATLDVTVSSSRNLQERKIMQEIHERWMREAVAQGAFALSEGEVPVGCVIVHKQHEQDEGVLVGRGSNKTNETRNGTRHAEFVAFDQVAQHFGPNPPYHELELYVTCEPCIMCAAAISRLELRKVYFGCHNDRFGGCGSILSLHDGKGLPETYHRYPIEAGILKEEAVNLFKRFYSQENCRAPEAKRRRKQLHAEGKPSSHDAIGLAGADDHQAIAESK